MPAADMYVKSGAGGGGDGSTWAQAWNEGEFETDLEANAEAGDRYFIMADANYVLDSDYDSSARDATAVAPIQIIGVKNGTTAEPPTTADWAYDTDRPTITNAGDYAIFFGDYYVVRNIIFHSDDSAYTLRIDSFGLISNCKITNDGNGDALGTLGSYFSVIDCQISSTNLYGIQCSSYNRIIGCYIYDSSTGIYNTDRATVINNIIDNCTTGINVVSADTSGFVNNTIYGCTTGITGTDSKHNAFVNNIIEGCTTEANWTTAEQKNNYWDYNCWGGATPTRTNVTAGPHAVDASASLTDPTAGTPDFTLQSGSPCLDAGLQFTDIVAQGNLAGDYKVNIGADQDTVLANVALLM